MSSSDPPASSKRDGPSRDTDPGDRHTGEGVASVRPRLARTLADSELLNGRKSTDAVPLPVPPDPEDTRRQPNP